MSKKCCVPVPDEQKKILKVLTCLYENYVAGKTTSTSAYFANPDGDLYDLMKTELDAMVALMNNYLTTNSTILPADSVVNIWTATAEGKVAYNSSETNNTFANAVGLGPASPPITNIKFNNIYTVISNLKTVQKLNLDDCVNRTYQVVPVTNYGTDYSNVTQASLVERVGCPGVSNLGFISIYIQTPIADAPFNTCFTVGCQ